MGAVHADRLAVRRRREPGSGRHPRGAGRRAGASVVHADEQLRFVRRPATGSGLGSARRGVFTIANHELQHYTTTIPAGTTSFRATIGNPSDPAADLDLFVYRCSDATCTTRTHVGQAADGDSEESVTLTNPIAATYQVDVDGFSVPAGSTTYDYVDVFANPDAGVGNRHGYGRTAQPGLDVDRARPRCSCPRCRGRSGDARERPGGHGRRGAGGLRGRGRRARHPVTPRTQRQGPPSGGPCRS